MKKSTAIREEGSGAAREAKALVALAFRNGPIENVHAGKACPTCQVFSETGIAINCVSCGYDLFCRFWPTGESEPGDRPADAARKYWRAYELNQLSPSYFISNLVDAICNVDRQETDYVWFALPDGKRPHMLAEKRSEDCERNA